MSNKFCHIYPAMSEILYEIPPFLHFQPFLQDGNGKNAHCIYNGHYI